MKYILILIILTSGCLHSEISIPDNTVVRVIDGDTLELSSGETVRLLCIDTPEVNEPGYQEAKDFTSQLIGKEIVLVGDVENRDRFGRLLRLVYLENSTKSINEMLLENSLAERLVIEPNVNLC